MKKSIYLRKIMFLVGICIPLLSFSQDLHARADELFRASKYYDAFFLYRQLFGNVISQNEAAQRCSHAMALTKQFKDYEAINKLYEARIKLKDLLGLNPEDFHKPELIKMTLDEATHLQLMAARQQTAEETNQMLDEAVSRYQETQSLGWKGTGIDAAIQQCLAARTGSETYIKTMQDEIKTLKIRNPEPIHKDPIVIILPKSY